MKKTVLVVVSLFVLALTGCAPQIDTAAAS